jgi:hypothetical protein
LPFGANWDVGQAKGQLNLARFQRPAQSKIQPVAAKLPAKLQFEIVLVSLYSKSSMPLDNLNPLSS